MKTATTYDAVVVDAHVTLVPVSQGDVVFLRDLYRARRQPELSSLPWSVEQMQAFCDMQHGLQEHHFADLYPNSVKLLICNRCVPVGYFSYCRLGATEIRVLDICLLPEKRGRGVGSAVMKWLQRYALQSEATVTLHITDGNPVHPFYRRLGFKDDSGHGPVSFMVWQNKPESVTSPQRSSKTR